MAGTKYEPIYKEIKDGILSGQYPYGSFLPSENEYAARFGCTRNTVRRALSILSAEGYVLPQHGRGVQVILQPLPNRSMFSIGGIESFAEAAKRNNISTDTRLITFEETVVDEKMSLLTGFDAGTELYHIERIRFVEGRAVIFDTNSFMKSETPGLTKAIAESSVYQYLEDELGMTITTSRRIITAEKASEKDLRYLDLGGLDFVLTVSGQVFNSRGVMFEYTQSRHVPDQVCFIEAAIRQKVS